MEQNKENIKISLCPRCQQKIIGETRYCKNCGFDLESDTKTETVLTFGLKEAVVVTSDETTEISYSQKETPRIRGFKHIQNIILLFISIMGILMMLFPIFNYNNVWSFISKIQESGYEFEIHEFLKFGSITTFFDLFPNVFKYIAEDARLMNASLMMFFYELAVLLIILVIIGLSVWLLILSLLNSYRKKLNPKYYKGIIGVNMALSLVLVFTLNCLGFGPICLSILCFLALVFFYVTDLMSKERRFMVKHLIHKSLCFILLFVLLFFSSFGLVNLNVDLGVNLYNFEPYIDSGLIDAPNIFACQGLFLEFMMFIQCSSGDDVFTTVTFSLCLLSFITHIGYIIFIELAMVDLLRGLSKQNVKFPVHFIIAATVAFYAFAVFTMLFNQIVNDAMFQKFIETIGQGDFAQLDVLTVENLKKTNRIFTIRTGMNTSIVLALPVCIYAVIAKKVSYKQQY